MRQLAVTVSVLVTEDVYPNIDAVVGRSTLTSVVGALLTITLIVAVLMMIVSGIVWAVSSATGNFQSAARGKAGLLIAAGAAALAGAGVAWMNFLIGVGRTL